VLRDLPHQAAKSRLKPRAIGVRCMERSDDDDRRHNWRCRGAVRTWCEDAPPSWSPARPAESTGLLKNSSRQSSGQRPPHG